MKKLIVRFIAFLLIVGGLTTSFLIVKPREKVKADTPSMYYWSSDTSHENYFQIILYFRDSDVIRDNNFDYYIYGVNKSNQEWSTLYQGSGQLLRYTNLDHDDFDAYIYNLNYPTLTTNVEALVIVFNQVTLAGEGYNFPSMTIAFSYYPTFKTYYDNGRDDGYEEGYQDGTNDRNAYWENYIEETYESTTGSGYQRIYEVGRTNGYRQGQESLDTMSWFQTITSGVSSVMNIHLLPSITIGTLIFIPFMFMVLGAVLWIWRKK